MAIAWTCAQVADLSLQYLPSSRRCHSGHRITNVGHSYTRTLCRTRLTCHLPGFSQGYRLLIMRSPKYRPINGHRLAFDCTYYVLSAALLVMILEMVIATSSKEVNVQAIAMAPPSVLYTIFLYVLLQGTLHALGLRAPFRISSVQRGNPVPPPVFTVMEDVFALQGDHLGLPAREALLALYNGSPAFRRTLARWSWAWGLGCGLMAVVLTIIVARAPPQVSFGISKFRLPAIHHAML
jgi:hypothetical protein